MTPDDAFRPEAHHFVDRDRERPDSVSGTNAGVRRVETPRIGQRFVIKGSAKLCPDDVPFRTSLHRVNCSASCLRGAANSMDVMEGTRRGNALSEGR